MIIHVDMDAFFASIEQAINPRLRKKPLIVGSRNNKLHTVVCAASYEAKAFGISSGMSSAEAFKLCPKLEFVAAEQSKYIWTSGQIFAMLKAYGYNLDYASIDEFQLETADLDSAQTLAKKSQKQIRETFQIGASIGIAKNRLLAKLASKLDKPNGLSIITDTNLEQVLAKVAVEKLSGIGAKTSLVLHDLGIKTCLDLYQKSAGFLEKNLGQNGLDFYYSLRSYEHLNPIQEDSQPKSIGHSYTFPRASQNTGFIHGWIRLLSEMVANRLRQENLMAKTIHLWLNGPEMPNFNTQKTFSESTYDGYEIYQKCLKIMSKIGQKTPKIRALGVTCSSLFQNNYLPLLNEEKRREDLLGALDKINRKFGDNSIIPASITLAKKLQ